MADDDARSSLFGAAPRRAGNKPNPYADLPSGSDTAPAPAPSHAADPFVSSDDAARSTLLAGGRIKKPDVSLPAAPPAPADTPIEPLDDDGQVEFDFDGLNLTAGLGSTARMGGGDGGGSSGAGGGDELNFDEIDSDLTNFAQDPVIREALSRGVDLRLYARQVDSELRGMEMLSIGDYIAESDAIAGLFEQITSCETVLGDMQGLLQSFQDNLGGISNEIRGLQEQSLGMSVKMANRKALAGKVKGFLTKVAVPEGLIDRIVEAPIDEAWMRDLRALGEKVAFTYGQAGSSFARGGAAAAEVGAAAPASSSSSSSSSSPAGAGSAAGGGAASAAAASDPEDLSDLSVSPFTTPAGREALPAIEKLKAKAVARLRDHFMRSMGELVKPKTSMQKQQEYVLMKAAPGMAFLTEFAPEVAREVRSAYADAVGRSMGDVFRRYHDDLAKAVLPLPAKGETVVDYSGRLVPAPGGLPLTAAAGVTGINPFALGPRLGVLEHASDPPLASHVVQAERLRLSFESVFRSLQRHLCDVAAAEDSFDRRFFGERYGPEVFGLVMSRSLNVLFGALEEYLSASSDAPGIMLLVALVAAHRKAMSDRGLTCLEGYFDRVVLLLWPRFKAVLDANVGSLKAAKEAPRAKLAGVGENGAPAAVGTGPLPVTARYAELVCAILVLHRALAEQRMSDDMLPLHIATFGRELDACLTKLAAEAHPSKVARNVMMINNLALVHATAQERRVHPDDAAPFEAALKAQVETYVESELDQHFRPLKSFVTGIEASALAAAKAAGIAVPTTDDSGRPLGPRLPEGVTVTASVADVENVLRDFGQNWRGGLKAMHDNVLRHFPDPRSGVGVLKGVMGSFVGLYERFHAVLTRAFPPTAPFLRDVVPSPTIFYELKRYSRAFEGQ